MTVDLETILLFADRGFPVLPLCSPTPQGCSYPRRAHTPICPDPGKKPIPYAGVRGATRDLDKIRQFWRWFPDANLGVAMGAASGHFAIETDGPKGTALLRRFRLPPTPTVVSRRGRHVYLCIPPGYTIRTDHFDELDVIGDRGYVVGPGSRHPSGHVYRWHDYLSLSEIAPAYPTDALLSWLTDHHVLRRETTPTCTARPRERTKIAPTSARAPGETRETGKTSPPRAGGFQTIITTHSQTVGTPLEKWLVDLARKPDVEARVLTYLGLDDLEFGQAHLCRLPGHQERHPSAVLYHDLAGQVVYICLHATDDEEHRYTLPAYFKAQVTQKVGNPHQRLCGPSLLPWWERLLVEAGVLEPMPVSARPLPPDVPASVRQVYTRFRDLCSCKWLYEPGAPTTFSTTFGLEWCGIGSHHTFRAALHWLLAHGYIEERPAYYSRKGQRLRLFMPVPPEEG